MTQHNTINIKLSNSQHHKLRLGIENCTEIILKISSNFVGDFNEDDHFPLKLLLSNTQASNLCKALVNGSSANIKLSITQLHKLGQSGEFLCRLLAPLLRTGLPFMKDVLKPLAKSVLLPIGLTPAASATDAKFSLIRKCLDLARVLRTQQSERH